MIFQFSNTFISLSFVCFATTLGATTGGIVAAVNQAYSINTKYEAFMTEINNLQTDLNILRNKIKANDLVLDNLNKTVGRLV